MGTFTLYYQTNLSQNLDKAFEQRFLYKIKFLNPSIEAKQSIWQRMTPALPKSWASELSFNYEFSRGQIENVVRKQAIGPIIHSRELSLDVLNIYCEEELLDKKVSRKRIGY